ncbi:MAG: hypothetical protein AAGF96_05820 [Bacteroidota bacterium]
MKSEKDIGKLIAERLSDAEVEQPSNLMWKTIEKTLIRRRFIRIGIISVSTIMVLASLSYFLILPTIQEKAVKKQTVPKTSRIIKNNSSDSNAIQSNLIRKDENQKPIHAGPINDSTYTTTLIEKNTLYRNPDFVQTKNSGKKSRNTITSKKVFPDTPSNKTLKNLAGKSKNSEKPKAVGSKGIDTFTSKKKKNNSIVAKASDKDTTKNTNEKKEIVQQSNSKIAEKSLRIKKEGATRESVTKNDTSTNAITASDSLISGPIDSLRSKKSNKISKMDRELKKSVSDSTDYKKKFHFEYYFLPVVSTSLYGRLQDQSTISAGLNENKKTANLRFGFGGYGLVRVNSKFEIRLGVLYSNYSKKTFDVAIIPNDNSTNFYENVDFENGLSYERFSNSFAQPTEITLQEEFAYLEFPVDFSYKVWEKRKWTVDVIAGVSTSLLLENRLNALLENDTLVFLGENTNYTKNIFSFRLGTGVYYNFSEYFALRLEILSKPTFGTFQTSQTDTPILLDANFGIALRL